MPHQTLPPLYPSSPGPPPFDDTPQSTPLTDTLKTIPSSLPMSFAFAAEPLNLDYPQYSPIEKQMTPYGYTCRLYDLYQLYYPSRCPADNPYRTNPFMRYGAQGLLGAELGEYDSIPAAPHNKKGDT